MPACIKNEFGTVIIENDVIARIAGLAAMDCYGIVGMAAKNVKDGFVQMLRLESITKGIHLKIIEGIITINLHVIIEYGLNIAAIADSIISTVKYRVEDCIGLSVAKVNIFIEGIRVE